VILPPLEFRGIAIKGILLTMAAEFLIDRYSRLQDCFHVIASSQTCSFPWSRRADALCSSYANPRRNAWFRRAYPERRAPLVPIQEADWTNELAFAPRGALRSRDLLCVSRQMWLKNLPLLAQMLAVYKRKYGNIRMTLVGGHNTKWSHLTGEPLLIMQEVAHILGDVHEYLDLVEFGDPAAMPLLYWDHKVLVLGSLIEGKNRGLHEAMAADTPVICFSAFNQYTRGDVRAFPPGAGEYAPFHPEGYADIVHNVLSDPGAFSPRAAYLNGFSGRMKTLETCLRALPVYQELVAEFDATRPWWNGWLRGAIRANYGCELETFIYEPNLCNAVVGMHQHDLLAAWYGAKCRRRW
jgi:glycosyltransferase involved in cell wall biosynthesis